MMCARCHASASVPRMACRRPHNLPTLSLGWLAPPSFPFLCTYQVALTPLPSSHTAASRPPTPMLPPLQPSGLPGEALAALQGSLEVLLGLQGRPNACSGRPLPPQHPLLPRSSPAGLFKLHEELPPITPLAVRQAGRASWLQPPSWSDPSILRPGQLSSPCMHPPAAAILQAEAEDNGAGWWRSDRPAAARPPAAGAATAGAAGASASILDALLVTVGEGGGPAPAHNAAALPPLLPAAGPPAQRCPPGAPRRHAAPLPPPPEVPASVLAGLRPASAPPAPALRSGDARYG